MDLLIQLFSSWIGILSAFVVIFIIGMAIYLYKWVGNNIEKEVKKHNSSASQ